MAGGARAITRVATVTNARTERVVNVGLVVRGEVMSLLLLPHDPIQRRLDRRGAGRRVGKEQ